MTIKCYVAVCDDSDDKTESHQPQALATGKLLGNIVCNTRAILLVVELYGLIELIYDCHYLCLYWFTFQADQEDQKDHPKGKKGTNGSTKLLILLIFATTNSTNLEPTGT